MATQTNPVSPIVGQKHKLDDKQDEVFNRGKRTISTSHFDIDIQRSDDSQRHGTLEASSNGHKDTEIKRLNLLLIEIEAKAITLANLVNVPTNTTIEQLPALIQSITKHLKFNIVPSTANTENCAAMDYAAGHGSEAFEESDKVIQKDSHEKNQVIEELPGSDSGSKGLGSDGEETIDKNDRCDEEDQETENADRDTDDDINSLWSNSKQEDLSSQAGSNLSLVYHGGHNKGRGGPRSTRKYAKRLARVKNARGGNPVRFQIYHQKQILLSPEPEPEE